MARRARRPATPTDGGRQSCPMIPSSSAMNCPRTRARRLHHFGVIERLRQHAGRHVGDARDAEHLDPHVPRDDRFRHGRHADRVGADRPQIADLGGRFVARPEQRDVDAVRQRQVRSPARLVGDARAAAPSRPRSCPESAAPNRSSLAPTSGLLPDQVDVIVDHHQRALREAGVHAAGGVGQDQRLDAEQRRARGPRTSTVPRSCPS